MKVILKSTWPVTEMKTKIVMSMSFLFLYEYINKIWLNNSSLTLKITSVLFFSRNEDIGTVLGKGSKVTTVTLRGTVISQEERLISA